MMYGPFFDGRIDTSAMLASLRFCFVKLRGAF